MKIEENIITYWFVLQCYELFCPTILSSQVPKRTTDPVGKANGFLKMVLSFELLAYAHFMTDVMKVLSTLTLFLPYEQAIWGLFKGSYNNCCSGTIQKQVRKVLEFI